MRRVCGKRWEQGKYRLCDSDTTYIMHRKRYIIPRDKMFHREEERSSFSAPFARKKKKSGPDLYSVRYPYNEKIPTDKSMSPPLDSVQFKGHETLP